MRFPRNPKVQIDWYLEGYDGWQERTEQGRGVTPCFLRSFNSVMGFSRSIVTVKACSLTFSNLDQLQRFFTPPTFWLKCFQVKADSSKPRIRVKSCFLGGTRGKGRFLLLAQAARALFLALRQVGDELFVKSRQG